MKDQIAGTQEVLTVEQYEDPQIRRLSEIACERRLAAFLSDAGQFAVSGSGSWHYSEFEFEGRLLKFWQYRLEAQTARAGE